MPDQFISGGVNFTAIPEYSIEAEGAKGHRKIT